MYSIKIPFAGDMPEGAQIQLFYTFRSNLGIPVSGPPATRSGPLATATVVGSQVFLTTGFGPYAWETPTFCGFFDNMLIWHAGGDGVLPGAGFMILNPTDLAAMASPTPLTISPSTLASIVPPLPAVFGPLTAKTLTISPGTGVVTLAGTGIASGFPVKFRYVFSLSPPQCGDLSPAVVNTVSMDIWGNNGSLLAFLINPLIDGMIPLFAPPASRLQLLIQSAVNGAVAAKFGTVPEGTTITITEITITPAAGIAVQAWASVPMANICVGGTAGGSVKIRSARQVRHLRQIRDRLLLRSPEGLDYIAMLKRDNQAIMTVFVQHQELLKLADTFVERVLEDFPEDAIETGKLRESTAAALIDLMDRVIAVAPKNLALTIQALKTHVRKFVGQSVTEVLYQSWSLLEGPQD